MKVIYNYFIPLPGYSAMMFFGVIFARKKYRPLHAQVINHEAIHKAQAKDCGGYIPSIFDIWGNGSNIEYIKTPFECEANTYATDLNYLKNRKSHAWEAFKTK